MTTLKTRMTYDESVMNHVDAMGIIVKQEKMAVKNSIFEDVTVCIDSVNEIYYDVRLCVRTCNGDYMYLYFTYNGKNLEVKAGSWNDIIDNYPPSDVKLYDTAMGKILDFARSFHPSTWTQVVDFFVVIRSIAKQEFALYNGQKEVL